MKKNNFKLNKIFYNNKGFALFYAMIIITIIASIAFGMASITLKQKNLASLAYDSQTAFYAADAGMECALFNSSNILSSTNRIDCFDFAPDNFSLNMQLENSVPEPNVWKIVSRKEPCFSFEFVVGTPPVRPSFSAKGYSTCEPNNVRYVERNLRAFF